ncbi:MAG: MBL fold metallo-hydrolase [Thermodesulfobacteriota bacterium]
MKIQWLGHAAFLLETKDGVRIVTDPYESGAYGGALGYGPIDTQADIVTVSHEQHEDHNHTSTVKGDPVIISGPGIETVKGVEMKRVHTYHDDSGGKERGENYVFCFKADGMRVCHMGDLGHVLSDEQVAEIGRPDVMLLPVGGTFTVGPEEASQVTDQLKPRIVIPMHYKTPQCGFPIEEVGSFLKGKSKVRKIGDSTVAIEQGSLPDSTEIVVLDPAL